MLIMKSCRIWGLPIHLLSVYIVDLSLACLLPEASEVGTCIRKWSSVFIVPFLVLRLKTPDSGNMTVKRPRDGSR